MTPELLLYETRGPVALLTLDRPEKLNAINAAMVDALDAALDRAEADAAVRVVVLRGRGRAFSAGFDVDLGAAAAGVQGMRETLTRDFELIMRFWDCPKPTVAAVHGYCLGSAMELAVACDVTLAEDGCRFGAPEVCFGSGIVTLILPWVVGPKLAKEMLLVGDDGIDAGRAERMGLVNRVVPQGRLEEEAMALARRIAANDRLAVGLTKQAINRSYEVMGMRQALLQALELDVVIESTETPESVEFNRIVAERGAKAAIAWRRSRVAGLTGDQ